MFFGVYFSSKLEEIVMFKRLSVLAAFFGIFAVGNPMASAEELLKAHYFTYWDVADNRYDMVPVEGQLYAMMVNKDPSNCIGVHSNYKGLSRINCRKAKKNRDLWRVYGIFDSNSAKLESAGSGLCLGKDLTMVPCKSRQTLIVELDYKLRIQVKD
jgi:hypothetical protein